MSSAAIRPRRSCLYLPGDKARVHEKARELPADVLIFDLEDAVAPEGKIAARAAVAQAVASRGYGRREVIVRVNGLGSDWMRDDLAAVLPSAPDGVLFPKINDAADIAACDAALAKAGAGPGMALWAMIETPLSILNLREIAAAGASTRLAGFIVGTNDLAKDLGAEPTPDRMAFLTPLSLTLVAARSHGLAAIDGVFNAIDDAEGLENECRQGRTLGYEGKTLIHPSQIEAANRVFAPDAAEVEQAHAVIAAFAEPQNAGKGVIRVNGRMTELLHLEQARRLVALAAAIEG